jgi:hypothetical protein
LGSVRILLVYSLVKFRVVLKLGLVKAKTSVSKISKIVKKSEKEENKKERSKFWSFFISFF